MRYRPFGNSTLKVSEIGFGAWAIGGGALIGETPIGWGTSDDAISKKAIHAAMDAGINFFDTADIYGLGHSENLLGETLGAQKDIIIATKVGNVSREEQFTTDYSYEYICKACEVSLKRLQRHTIDYYQLHTVRLPQLEKGICLRAMEDLQKAGKIRYWGVSLNTFDPEPEADWLLQHSMGAGWQLVLNIINQRALGLLKKAGEKGYGVIARMPLQFGLLTGKFDATSSFPDNDHRKKRLTRSIIEMTKEALEPVWALCEKYQCTKTQLALSYIISYPEVSTIIPGIRNPQQVFDNTNGLFEMSDEDRSFIETLGRKELAIVLSEIQKQG